MNKTLWKDFVKQCNGLTVFVSDSNSPLRIKKDLIEYWEPTIIENSFNLYNIKAEDNPIIISYKNGYQFIAVGGEILTLDLMLLKPFLVN